METSNNDKEKDDQFTSEERHRHEALLSHDQVLIFVQEWLQLPLSSSSTSLSKDDGGSSTCTLSLATTGPLTLKQANNGDDTAAIAVLRFDNPKALSSQTRSRLESAVLPYVCRAFGQSMDTVDPQILQEHRDHLTPGDVLFCAVQVQADAAAATGTTTKSKSKSHHRPRFVAHMLLSILNDIHMDTSNDTSNIKKAVCIIGRVCDPDFQNRGVSSHMQSVAFGSLQPDVIVTRTANPSILRLLHKAALELMGRRNSDNANGTDKNIIKHKIFPDDCHTPSDWQLARHLANQIVTKWEHLHPDRDKYDEQYLVFRNLYSTINQQVFGGGNDEGKQASSTSLEFLNAGDAVLRLLVILDPSTSSSKAQ